MTCTRHRSTFVRTPIMLLAALACAAACRATPPPAPPEESVPALPQASAAVTDAAPAWELPVDWERGSFEEFEAQLERWFPSATPVAVSETALRELASAAAEGGESGLRAVLVLARSYDADAFSALLAVLDQRTPRSSNAADPGGDAALVVAAAALANARTVAAAGPRLESLSFGKNPHPDLDVRVQCAASALALGRTRAIPYLLGILRTGTSARAAAPRGTHLDDFVEPQLVAARALSARAGVPCEFRARAPLAARAAEADRLERLLAKER
ncbi:MAG: hypothetical protein ACKVWV_12340 [Planctomycetota bacterium]